MAQIIDINDIRTQFALRAADPDKLAVMQAEMQNQQAAQWHIAEPDDVARLPEGMFAGEVTRRRYVNPKDVAYVLCRITEMVEEEDRATIEALASQWGRDNANR